MVKCGLFSSAWLGWIADLLMSILPQRSRVTDAGILDLCQWRRDFALKYRKSVTRLLRVDIRKTKIPDISVVEVSNRIYFPCKLKTAKSYLSCCVAAFDSTMLTSTASRMVLLWGMAELQGSCIGQLISGRCEHYSCCHLQPYSSISFHLLCFYRIPIFVRACVSVCVSILSFLVSSFPYILPSYQLTSFFLCHSFNPPTQFNWSILSYYFYSHVLEQFFFLMRKEFVNMVVLISPTRKETS